MHVRVSDVKKWAGREETTHLVEPWPEEAQRRVEFPLMNPAEVDVKVRNARGGSFIVEVSGAARLEAVCSRCLKTFELSSPFALTEEFREQPGESDPLQDYFRFTGDKLYVDDMVSDAVAVSLPMRVVCQVTCRGLCPRCGSDLNQGPCACEPLQDDRWAALSQFTFPKKD